MDRAVVGSHNAGTSGDDGVGVGAGRKLYDGSIDSVKRSMLARQVGRVELGSSIVVCAGVDRNCNSRGWPVSNSVREFDSSLLLGQRDRQAIGADALGFLQPTLHPAARSCCTDSEFPSHHSIRKVCRCCCASQKHRSPYDDLVTNWSGISMANTAPAPILQYYNTTTMYKTVARHLLSLFMVIRPPPLLLVKINHHATCDFTAA